MRRKPIVPSVLAAAVILLASGPAATGGDGFDERITLDLEDAPLREVFAIYEEILNLGLDVDPAIDGTITISFENVTVRTSLNAICESAGCRWERVDGDPATLRIDRDASTPGRGEAGNDRDDSRRRAIAAHGPEAASRLMESPVSIELDEANATKVLGVAAKIVGAKLLMDRRLGEKTVTIHTSAAPLSEVLDTVCDDLGCAWELTEGDPPVLRVHLP